VDELAPHHDQDEPRDHTRRRHRGQPCGHCIAGSTVMVFWSPASASTSRVPLLPKLKWSRSTKSSPSSLAPSTAPQ
jgi:hypothetical protein